ncbi:Listeria/Bacterioides repeat [Candidatus Nanopelagicaceae bacterium]
MKTKVHARVAVFSAAISLVGLAQLPQANSVAPTFDIYMDQPLVQGSYVAPDADAVTDTFNDFPTTGPGSCSNATFRVGTVVGTCSVYDSIDFGASDTGSAQFIGGSGSKMISGYPGANYKITFSEDKKYVGFWWSAGSNGNTVNFYSSGAIVATMDVNQVFSKFGTAPFEAGSIGVTCYGQPGETASAVNQKCFGNTTDTNDSGARLTSIDGTRYLKNLYFGNPDGYTPPSGGPSNLSPSSRMFSEPFVYIHAFASSGASFDAVEFSGSGFEIDNLTVASTEKTPRNSLVFVQQALGSFVASFDSQGGSAVEPTTFISGGTIDEPGSPTRSGYSFAGWTESTTSTTGLSFPYSPGVDSDITLFGKWFRYSGIAPNNGLGAGSWIQLTGDNLSHSFNNGFGYENVYYRSVADRSGASPGSWIALSSGEVRDGIGTSIEVVVPSNAGINYYQFHIDVCRNWTTHNGCVSLDNSAVYSIPAWYSVAYDGNLKTTGTVPTDASSPYENGATVNVLTNSGVLARTGYTFAGWNTLANGTGTNYLSDGSATFSVSSTDVTLFAKWNADTHTVSFDSQGGSAVSSATFTTDGSISLPTSPTRTGYTFNGWFVNSAGGSALTSPYSPGVLTDITLFAQWTQDAPPGGGGGGGGSSQNQNTSAPEAKVPGITWTPSAMVEGDAIGDLQLNAVFSTPGNAVYSLSRGFKPDPGNIQLTVTFTPEDKATYMVLSTTRTIEVAPKPKPSPSPTPTISPSPSASATPDATPKPTVTPKPTTVKVSELKLIGTIYFNNNEYFLDAKDRSSLVEISTLVKKSKFETVLIQGNTDIKQGVDNYWLSKSRAEAVSNYLADLANGPFYNRVWYASKRPIAVGLDKKSLALNRRVEIYAQVTVEKLTAAVTTASQAPLARSFEAISFNRNEYFLDAADRKSLVDSVQNMAKLGCAQVYLKGSHDKTRSSVNAYIGANRVNAVKKFMAGLLPTLKFSIEPEFVSADRVVQIRCTN